MRLKLSTRRDATHTEAATVVGWATSDELLSCGDDHRLIRWNTASDETSEVARLPDTVYPTALHWFPRSLAQSSKRATGTDLFALGAADGKFYLISKSGRVEKTVDAHKGAVLSVRWSYDGTGLLTVGEDGAARVWSRGGMLRSTLSQQTSAAYGGRWSADNGRVLLCCGSLLVIKSLQASVKPLQWKAHDGVILALDWSVSTELVVSGGEDGKYKLWDGFGRPLYVSSSHEWPITSVAWSADGHLFAVGTFNTLRLCDRAGWSHSMEKLSVGSVFDLCWSPDATQLAGACASGHVIQASVVDRRVEWRRFEAVQTKRRTVEVRDSGSDAKEKLDVKDRVTKVALSWDHLIITTASQCHIYNSKNWNTPTVMDLKEGSVSLIVTAPRLFLLVDGSLVSTYSFEGRFLASIKVQGMRTEVLNDCTLALANDTVAVRDKGNEKAVHLLDASTGRPTGSGKIAHSQEIVQVALDQCGAAADRRFVMLDKNNDLFICPVKPRASGHLSAKLGGMVQCVCFNDTTNMLAGLCDDKLLVWAFPSAAFVDKEIVPMTVFEKDAADFGKTPQLLAFVGNRVTVRRADGSLMSRATDPFASFLHAFADAAKWDHALRLCRHVRSEQLWATLAAMASNAKQLNTAEIAYGAINEAEKVQLLEEIRRQPNKDVRSAELALFCGNVQEAENTLLHSGHHFRAVLINLHLYRWQRAMKLAMKHNHVDVVVAIRQQYLEQLDRPETIDLFEQQAADIDVDIEQVESKINNELQIHPE